MAVCRFSESTPTNTLSCSCCISNLFRMFVQVSPLHGWPTMNTHLLTTSKECKSTLCAVMFLVRIFSTTYSFGHVCRHLSKFLLSCQEIDTFLSSQFLCISVSNLLVSCSVLLKMPRKNSMSEKECLHLSHNTSNAYNLKQISQIIQGHWLQATKIRNPDIFITYYFKDLLPLMPLKMSSAKMGRPKIANCADRRFKVDKNSCFATKIVLLFMRFLNAYFCRMACITSRNASFLP